MNQRKTQTRYQDVVSGVGKGTTYLDSIHCLWVFNTFARKVENKISVYMFQVIPCITDKDFYHTKDPRAFLTKSNSSDEIRNPRSKIVEKMNSTSRAKHGRSPLAFAITAERDRSSFLHLLIFQPHVPIYSYTNLVPCLAQLPCLNKTLTHQAYLPPFSRRSYIIRKLSRSVFPSHHLSNPWPPHHQTYQVH